TYHAPQKVVRVISGHLGWVPSVAVKSGNQWFAIGAGEPSRYGIWPRGRVVLT
ncbi:hypothetical protein DFH08DRAFT_906006, partial [Mycena albidolilacea]